jgi:hypothetical protein
VNLANRSRPLLQEKSMSHIVRIAVGAVFLQWGPLATAQSTLGALLDAGATIMTTDEFRKELTHRIIVGPGPAGGTTEIVYAESGSLTGTGSNPNLAVMEYGAFSPIDGTWTTDNEGRVCTIMIIKAQAGGTVTVLPRRCQYWFKSADAYYLSDSDSDRSAKVLRRTVRQ